MAYNKKDIFDKAKKAIQQHEPLFTEDLIAFLPCGKTTFYDFFPDGSDELNELKDLINQNKISQKAKLRKNWKDPESAPALQLALYKLLASPNEHKALQMQYNDHTTQGEKINIISLGNGTKPETDK